MTDETLELSSEDLDLLINDIKKNNFKIEALNLLEYYMLISNIKSEDLEKLEILFDLLKEKRKESRLNNNYFLPISKLSKYIPNLMNGERVDGSEIGTIQIPKIKRIKNSSDFYIRVKTELNKNIQIPYKYNYYLDNIQNAVSTLFLNGEGLITAEKVYRLISGLDKTSGIKIESLQKIESILDFFTFLKVKIDRTEEYNALKKDIREHGELSPICNFYKQRYITRKNGTQERYFFIAELPPIFAYSQELNQYRTIPTDILNIKTIRSNSQNTAIKFYLLQQIESMKSNNKISKTMKINKIYNALKYDLESNNKNQRIAKKNYILTIETILNYWIELDYIKGYQINRNGIAKNSQIESITIKTKKTLAEETKENE